MLRTGVLAGADGFRELEASWQDLAASSPTATPFQTWEWQSTWFRHFGGRKRPLFFLAHEGDDLVGLMPLVRTSGPWRALRAMGSGPSDILHPLAREGYESAVAEALAHRLRELKDVDVIDLHQVRETHPLAAMADLQPAENIEQARCLILDLPETYESYLATLGKSLRYDVRKLDKELFADGRARMVDFGPDDLDLGLDQLFESHMKRWRKRGMPGAFGARSRAFHREWAELASRRGWLWLTSMIVDGEPAGTIYAMAMGQGCYYYQAGLDPEKSSLSPGSLLVAYSIRKAIGEGKQTFDFLRGDEPYKRRWKPQRMLTNRRLLMPAGGLLGRLGTGWNRAGSRVESRVRARLEGRGLI